MSRSILTLCLLLVAVAALAGQFPLTFNGELVDGTVLNFQGFYAGVPLPDDDGPPSQPQNLALGDTPPPPPAPTQYHAFLGERPVLSECEITLDLGPIARDGDNGQVVFRMGEFAAGDSVYVHLSRTTGPLAEREWDVYDLEVWDPGPPGAPSAPVFSQ